MSQYRKLILPLALLTVATFTTAAQAQRFQPFGPLLGEEFDHDFQIFAPAEVSSFGGGPEPNYGLFLGYDRIHFNVARSNEIPGRYDGDWGYGNRVDLGYMTTSDHGWLFEMLKVSMHENGPATFSQLSSGELMKTWRHKPLHYGSIVETFIGGRFAVLKHERLSGNVTVDHIIENNIFGPQAGLRWFKQKGHWTLSAEGRYFYGYNNQKYRPNSVDPQGVQQHRWVHAGDVRTEVTYDLTKSCALSVGAEMLYFANGIARGGPTNNDQDALYVGATFGIKFNR